MMIFFDLDDTLLDHTYAENAAAEEFYGLHHAVFPDSPEEFVKRWAVTARKHIDRYLSGELTFQGQRRERIRELFSHRSRLADAEADRLFESYLRSYEQNWKPFSDVAGCLEDLTGTRLGVITNGDGVQQRRKLEALGLTGRLATIVVSGEVGLSKPDTQIFLRACAQGGVGPSECWHVGDDLELDTRGAVTAGLHAIWLNRKGLPLPEGVPAIASLSELKGLVQGRRSTIAIGVAMLNRRIERIAARQEISLIGFADLSGYADDLVAFGGDIVRGYPSAISIGIALPNNIVDGLRDRNNPNNASLYRHHAYDVINMRLDLATSLVSSFLSREGYNALPIPAAERTDVVNAIPTVSHKMVAHIAGLGWIGKNCLLITPQYGPRVRLATLLTDAPLSTVDNPVVRGCNGCRACVEACPVNAIKGRDYVSGEAREERFSFTTCHAYFEELKKDPSKKPVCGMCLYVCPYGRRRGKEAEAFHPHHP